MASEQKVGLQTAINDDKLNPFSGLQVSTIFFTQKAVIWKTLGCFFQNTTNIPKQNKSTLILTPDLKDKILQKIKL